MLLNLGESAAKFSAVYKDQQLTKIPENSLVSNMVSGQRE